MCEWKAVAACVCTFTDHIVRRTWFVFRGVLGTRPVADRSRWRSRARRRRIARRRPLSRRSGRTGRGTGSAPSGRPVTVDTGPRSCTGDRRKGLGRLPDTSSTPRRGRPPARRPQRRQPRP